jgi:hypothetical protein
LVSVAVAVVVPFDIAVTVNGSLAGAESLKMIVLAVDSELPRIE